MRIVGSALWGKREGGARPRALIAAAAAVAALAAPALAHAAAIPSSLLAEAQANPSQTFGVIVQTASAATSPLAATVDGVTQDQRKAFNDAFKQAQGLARKAADLANQAAKAQQRSTDAAAKAAQTGKPGDQTAAAQAAADAQAAQAAAAAAQNASVVAQLTMVQNQAALLTALGQAQGDIRWQYQVIPAVAANLTGADILDLQSSTDVLAVSADAPVRLTGNSNSQKWVDAVGAHQWWGSPQRKQAQGLTPTIAIVDSGVDASRVQDFGGRVLGQVNLDSLSPNSPGDGRGHGTMVASIAAGAADRHTGVNPDAPLISLDVINDNGEGLTSDVIAAADWILQNKNTYNIRVANFSLQGAVESSFMYDPLSKAVEQLWFNGVVVVAAAGNYGTGGAPSGEHFAPASDPFVITVGALDIGRDGNVKNDVAAPWSAWGYTNDGFIKPDISAPGRYIVGACSPGGTLCQTGGQNPALAPSGYIQLSGTSFAAPMVAGVAAAILGEHPDWTPDQVKGQLMLTADRLPAATPGSAGVGEVDMKAATDPRSAAPPNPNQALDGFIASTLAGPVFDAASWSSAAQANASWNAASWSSASWSSASWSSASWSSASWSSASWSSASWNAASWNSSTSGLSLVDNAALDGPGEG